LQRRRFEAFDLDDNLSASRRPHPEMDAAVGLWFGADRQATHRRLCGRNQLSDVGDL
jgi:hypothetical protein